MYLKMNAFAKVYLFLIVISGLVLHITHRYGYPFYLNIYLLFISSVFLFFFFQSKMANDSVRPIPIIYLVFLWLFSYKFGVVAMIKYLIYIMLPVVAFLTGKILNKEEKYLYKIFIFLIIYGSIQSISYFIYNSFLIPFDNEIFTFGYKNIKIFSESIIRPFSTFHLFQDYQVFITMITIYLVLKSDSNKVIVAIIILYFLQFSISLERTPLLIFLPFLFLYSLVYKKYYIITAIVLISTLLFIYIYSNSTMYDQLHGAVVRIIGDPEGSKELRYSYYWVKPIMLMLSSMESVIFGSFDQCPLPICENYFPPHNSFIALYMMYGIVSVFIIFIFLYFLVNTIRKVRNHKERFLLGIISVLFIFSCVYNTYIFGLSSFGFFMLLGLLSANSKNVWLMKR